MIAKSRAGRCGAPCAVWARPEIVPPDSCPPIAGLLFAHRWVRGGVQGRCSRWLRLALAYWYVVARPVEVGCRTRRGGLPHRPCPPARAGLALPPRASPHAGPAPPLGPIRSLPPSPLVAVALARPRRPPPSLGPAQAGRAGGPRGLKRACVVVGPVMETGEYGLVGRPLHGRRVKDRQQYST